MNVVITVLRVIVSIKELRIVLWIMLFLTLLPAMTIAVIAETPKAMLESIFGGDSTDIEAYTSLSDTTVKPTPFDIHILGNFAHPGNTYAPGNCTSWVYARRDEIGKKIPNTWGNANTWDDRARRDGYVVDHTPKQYAVVQTDRGKLGHVMFVERINSDGSWYLSEMNALGLYIVSHRSMPASAAISYNFIH